MTTLKPQITRPPQYSIAIHPPHRALSKNTASAPSGLPCHPSVTALFQMLDANQVWEVQEAIEWVKKLAPFKPLWIEEPTSPDDVLGNAAIAKALKPLGILVASGEMCANRVMFKQFLQADAMQICQIDSARIGGVNEILAVYLMARKLGGKLTSPGNEYV